MAKILPFKTRQQLETEEAVKVIKEWEDNWHHVEGEAEEHSLSQDEIEWLNEWLQDDK